MAHFKLLIAELHFEKKFAISTATFKASPSKAFYHYQGAGYLVVFRILNDIFPLTTTYDFVDIGCGKGRALIVAEYLGYSALYGIELNEDLLVEAKANVGTYPFKRKTSEFHFVHTNALDYSYKDIPTLYFLFNPFDAETLNSVLKRIVMHTKKETYFIYMNPRHSEAFEQNNIPFFKKYKTGWYTEANVYRLPLIEK